MSEEQPVSLVQPPKQKLPLLLKILAVILIVIGVLSVPLIALVVVGMLFVFSQVGETYGTMTMVIVNSAARTSVNFFFISLPP